MIYYVTMDQVYSEKLPDKLCGGSDIVTRTGRGPIQSGD